MKVVVSQRPGEAASGGADSHFFQRKDFSFCSRWVEEEVVAAAAAKGATVPWLVFLKVSPPFFCCGPWLLLLFLFLLADS